MMSSAASMCNVTQSAITLSIKSLEEQIGFDLFERTAHGVNLSFEGQRFLGKAREILSLVSNAAISSVESEASKHSGSITVGATDTVMGYFLMPHLARFKSRFPHIDVNIIEMGRQQIEDALIAGTLDIAVMLVSNLQRQDELAASVLRPSQRRLWLPSRHPLLLKQSITLADVAKEPMVMLTVDEAEESALNYWSHLPQEPRIVLRSANVEAIRTAVASGLGVTILSDMVFRTWSLEGDRIEARDLATRVPPMDIGLSWRLGATLSPSAQEFQNFIKAASVGIVK